MTSQCWQNSCLRDILLVEIKHSEEESFNPSFWNQFSRIKVGLKQKLQPYCEWCYSFWKYFLKFVSEESRLGDFLFFFWLTNCFGKSWWIPITTEKWNSRSLRQKSMQRFPNLYTIFFNSTGGPLGHYQVIRRKKQSLTDLLGLPWGLLWWDMSRITPREASRKHLKEVPDSPQLDSLDVEECDATLCWSGSQQREIILYQGYYCFVEETQLS